MDGNSPAVKKLYENIVSTVYYRVCSLTFGRNSTGKLSAFALEKKGWTTTAKSGWFCLADNQLQSKEKITSLAPMHAPRSFQHDTIICMQH